MAETQLPKISIVTPSFNQAQFLEETIDSVLSQGYPNLEYIVMDGGSTDGSVDIIRRYSKHLSYWQSQPDGGQSVAINAGFERATGSIMGWLNSDDKLKPDSLETIAAELGGVQAPAWLIGGCEIIQLNGVCGLRIPEPLSADTFLNWEFGSWFPQQSTFWNSGMWKLSGTLDVHLRYVMDLDIWMRMWRVALPKLTPQLLAVYRHHPQAKCFSDPDHVSRETRLVLVRNMRQLGVSQAREAAWRIGVHRYCVTQAKKNTRSGKFIEAMRYWKESHYMRPSFRTRPAAKDSSGHLAIVSTMRGYGWGGSEELWSRSALRLLADGFEIDVHTKRWHEPIWHLTVLEKAGASLFIPPPSYRSFFRRLLDRLRTVQPPVEAWLESRRPSFCLISMGWFQEGLEWMQACQKLKIPYAVLVQAAGVGLWSNDDEVRSLRQGYLAARVCYFVSLGNLKVVQSQLACRLDNAKIIYNPVNVARSTVIPWPATDAGWRLACVARLDFYSKGQDLWFDVLTREKWRQRALTVSLYGAGPCQGALQQLKQLHDLNNLSLKGHVTDVAGIWRENHGLIMPSRIEGLPLALVEAMLCGRMAVVTDVGGNAEVVEDGITGFIARAPTAGLLDEALERAWERREEWQAMGQRAGQTIREKTPEDPIGFFVEDLLRVIRSPV